MSNPDEISYDDWLAIAQLGCEDDEYLALYDWNFYYISGACPLKTTQHYNIAKAYNKKILQLRGLIENEV